jgi:uncharacterized RDD family membrane protein YckC
MNTDYYILEDDEKKGPYTFDELAGMNLDIFTQISAGENGDWENACDLPELYRYFERRGIYLPTPDNLASFWWRLAAYVIDYIILSILLQFIFTVLASYGIDFNLKSYNDLFKISLGNLLLLQLISSLTLIIYNSLCEASPMQGSVGKRIFRMVVVDANGDGLTYLNALGRSAGKALSIFLLYIGFISIFWSEYRQAWHDQLAKTYVVKRD